MFKSLRDSHSLDDYNERKAKLFSMTEGLLVRPGRVKVPVLFVDYFLKNWEPIKHMWVLAFRKSYPIQGQNDTQAVERLFRSVKMYEKQVFGQRTPTLEAFIPMISEVLDTQFRARQILAVNKTPRYFHPIPAVQKALESASWVLNPLGMKLYDLQFRMLDAKRKDMNFEAGVLYEKYDNRVFTGTREYITDGKSCSCNYKKNYLFCRHQIYFNEVNNLPLFNLNMFDNRLLKIEAQATIEHVETDTSLLHATIEDLDISPSSPGMESVLEE